MFNDEREHVWKANTQECIKVVKGWAEIIRKEAKNVDGTSPEVVMGSEIITSVRSAQKVGEELSRANCKQVILCYYVWNFPFFVWPFINSLGRNKPILCLSNNSGKFPGNVGLLATDGGFASSWN